MKTILVHYPSGDRSGIFAPNQRDGISDPAICLQERLQALGYQLVTADDHPVDDSTWVLFYDAVSVNPYNGWRGMARWCRTLLTTRRFVRDVYDECCRAGLQDRMALFLWEPPSTTPANYSQRLHERFPVIFTWSDRLADGRKFNKVLHPQTRRFPVPPSIPFGQRKLLVSISANKTSRHPRELYSARRAAIRYFEQRRPADFDLYGVGWDRSATIRERFLPSAWRTFSSYRGTVPNKWDVFPRYRFSICYENIRDEPGYVTEKIFDSLRSGCVPIYWGAPNITDYVDAEAFVDRRRFQSDAEVEAYIVGMTEREYMHFQDAIQSYLNSERFARFLSPAFVETVIRALNL